MNCNVCGVLYKASLGPQLLVVFGQSSGWVVTVVAPLAFFHFSIELPHGLFGRVLFGRVLRSADHLVLFQLVCF